MRKLKHLLARVGLLDFAERVYLLRVPVDRKFQQWHRQRFLKSDVTSTFVDRADVIETLSLLRPSVTDVQLMRVGSNADGGYLVPADLSFIDGCFSPGVANLSDFEMFLASKGIRSFMADASVDGPAGESEYFDFEKKFLGLRDDANWLRLDTWVKEKSPQSSNLILQIDIEGSEWPVLLETESELLRKFALIVIEMHDLHMIGTLAGLASVRTVLQKLDQDFAVCHIHPNNNERVVRVRGIEVPPVLELTYIRKDLISKLKSTDEIQIIEELDNASFMPSIVLNEFLKSS